MMRRDPDPRRRDGPGGLSWREVGFDDPLLQPVFAELAVEYGRRYGEPGGRYIDEDNARNGAAFTPPGGAMLAIVEDGQAVATAGFVRVDDSTAEVKRVWTAATHRRLGLSRTLMSAVEQVAGERGYRRLELTTGSRQPEAVALYGALGWTRDYDPADPPEGYRPFTKRLAGPAPPSVAVTPASAAPS